MGTITVSNLGKAYKQYPTRWSRLAEWLAPGHKPRHSLKWILKDISFTVPAGEAVGIIGVNGAGKSTLLKMITGTTQPTAGSLTISGRVAALLELGMGFHPDFTGRQNAVMAGQLAGFTAEEIERLLPEIESFADVGEYFDKPVRTYSSGMQARVAFAVATGAVPDVLIVDEALSVGDMAFQAKCMQRMRNLLDRGTTVLFVSHSLNQIRQFCSRALYLSAGAIKAWGDADYVCDLYQNDLSGYTPIKTDPEYPAKAHRSSDRKCFFADSPDPLLRKYSLDESKGGSLELEFWSFQVTRQDGSPASTYTLGEVICFEAIIYANEDVPAGSTVGLLLADKAGYPLAACNSNFYGRYVPELKKGMQVRIEWQISCPFVSGEFRVDIGIKSDPFSPVLYDRVFCAAVFTVIADASLIKENFGGYLLVEADVSIALAGN